MVFRLTSLKRGFSGLFGPDAEAFNGIPDEPYFRNNAVPAGPGSPDLSVKLAKPGMLSRFYNAVSWDNVKQGVKNAMTAENLKDAASGAAITSAVRVATITTGTMAGLSGLPLYIAGAAAVSVARAVRQINKDREMDAQKSGAPIQSFWSHVRENKQSIALRTATSFGFAMGGSALAYGATALAEYMAPEVTAKATGWLRGFFGVAQASPAPVDAAPVSFEAASGATVIEPVIQEDVIPTANAPAGAAVDPSTPATDASVEEGPKPEVVETTPAAEEVAEEIRRVATEPGPLGVIPDPVIVPQPPEPAPAPVVPETVVIAPAVPAAPEIDLPAQPVSVTAPDELPLPPPAPPSLAERLAPALEGQRLGPWGRALVDKALSGDQQSQYRLAESLLHGRNRFSVNIDAALELFREAQAGPNARMALDARVAETWMQGNGIGMEANRAAAVSAMRDIVRTNPNIPQAQQILEGWTGERAQNAVRRAAAAGGSALSENFAQPANIRVHLDPANACSGRPFAGVVSDPSNVLREGDVIPVRVACVQPL